MRSRNNSFIIIVSVVMLFALALSGCAPSATQITEAPMETEAATEPAVTEEVEATVETEAATEPVAAETEAATEPVAAETEAATEPAATEEAVLPLSGEAIRIGFSSPLSGPAAGVGQHKRWGAELAVEEINQRGGILGRPVELLVEDNACNPTEGVTAVSRLLEQDISAFVGPMCSSVALAVIGMFQEAEVPMVIGTATSPDITPISGQGGNEWAFRITPSDNAMAAAEIPYLVDQENMETISLVAEDTDFGRGVAQAFAEQAEAHGMTVSSTDFFAKGTPDFTTILTRVQRLNPDGLAIFAVGNDDINLVRQYISFGLNSRLVGRPELDLLFDNLEDPSGIEGAISVIQYTIQVDTPENIAFIEAFNAKYGENPVLQSAQGYQAVLVVADAIERAGSAEPAAIRDALEETSFPGLMGGPIEFDEFNQAHPKIAIFRVENGEVVVAAVLDS